MPLKKLCEVKGVTCDGAKLMDRMGKAELAANLFRITQTDEKIKNENIRGQVALEDAAFKVGRAVRETMIKTGGSAPEVLPLAEDIGQVKRKIKGTNSALDGGAKKLSGTKGDVQ